MAHSIYEPLKPDEIRLIHISSGPWSSPLECTLQTASLVTDGQARPASPSMPFVALSYTWGPQSPSLQLPIKINNTTARIGRNLYIALRYYRHCGLELPIWVDSICINQDDLDERGEQVGIMDAIYSSAKEVIAFLGSGVDAEEEDFIEKVMMMGERKFVSYAMSGEVAVDWKGGFGGNASGEVDEETEVLFEFLQGACNLKIRDHLSEVPRWGRQPRDIEEHNYPWEVLIRSLQNFLKAPWWSRVWTVQESVVGEGPTLFYRAGAASWEFIVEAVGGLQAHVSDCCTPYLRSDAPDGYAEAIFDLIKRVEDIQRARRTYRNIHGLSSVEGVTLGVIEGLLKRNTGSEPASVDHIRAVTSRMLLEHLQSYQHREATDPRDKVYSLLNLVKTTGSGPLIHPDYQVPTAKLYMATARTIIEDSGSLEILAVAGTISSSATELPSWCPDWSSTTRLSPESISQIRALKWYNATANTPPNILSSAKDQWQLNVQGVVVDRILSLGDASIPEENTWKLLFGWTKIVPENTKWIDFCRTARGDIWMGSSQESFYRMGGELRRETSHERCWVDPVSGELREELPSPDIVKAQTFEEMVRTFREWDCVISTQAARRGSQGGGATPLLEEQLRTSTAQRRLMVSSQNTLGLVPADAEVGDSLVILRGCRFPCVLRRASDSQLPAQVAAYRVVGSAYVHGIMDGEFRSCEGGLAGGSAWRNISLH
ncbi:heterokaryon incompatibility protein-domain-containing protein [Cercophora newfieldiana]|uniref:Heterokaryon incompatibility protein-domain-containing protein n=1 Tax=Cercophora newfieldiana TaxID=92897 RepID=A0AA39Y1I6_9PEZI|nr:heterokaryon incompatibility protein-domain-containing protein [Cercophora newfieldiana]